MKRKQILFTLLLIAGLCLVGAALVLQKHGVPDKTGGMLMGLGSGMFTASAATLLTLRQERKNPAAARQNEISLKDERNIAMRNRAKALAGDVLQWTVLAAAWVAIGLGASLWIVLLAVGVFVAKSLLELYLLLQYQKTM